ncbi:hypothetical protein ABFS82_01G044700 [Erythranthe guttata]
MSCRMRYLMKRPPPRKPVQKSLFGNGKNCKDCLTPPFVSIFFFYVWIGANGVFSQCSSNIYDDAGLFRFLLSFRELLRCSIFSTLFIYLFATPSELPILL